MKRTPFKRKPVKKRKVASPLKKAKNQLWELCKQITRRKYGNSCYTCLQSGLEGSNWHTGHFVTKSTCSTELAYDLRNLRPQCYHCNINLSGNWVAFERHLKAFEGEKYVTDLKARNERTKGMMYRLDWYEAKIEDYKKILDKS